MPSPIVATFFQTAHPLGRLEAAVDGVLGFILFAACTSAQSLSSESNGRARQRCLLLVEIAQILILHLFPFFRWSALEGPVDTRGIWCQFTHFYKGIGSLGKPVWTMQFPLFLKRHPITSSRTPSPHHSCSSDRGTKKPGS